MSNYYDLLGIPKTATVQEIKSAYKKNALKFHPDRNATNSDESKLAEERFKLINEAYQVLSDPYKKMMYDNQLEFEEVKRQQYYKQYTSTGNYGSDSSNSQSEGYNQNTQYQQQQGTGYTYRRRETKKEKQPTFVFGKTEIYIVLGFALMTVFAYFLMNFMNSYSYDMYIEEAKVAIDAEDFARANRALEDAKSQKEKDAEINYLLGKIEAEYKKDYVDAIEFFDKAIAYSTEDEPEVRAKYYKTKGDTYLLMNEYYQSIEEYKKAVSLSGYDQIAIMNIADLYLEKLKDYNKASLYFDEIIDNEPDLVEPYIGKAVAKLQAKDYQAMGELLDKAIKINPKNAYLWYYKGFYFWEKPNQNAEEGKAKDKENACESWKIAVSYGSQESHKPLSNYCK